MTVIALQYLCIICVTIWQQLRAAHTPAEVPVSNKDSAEDTSGHRGSMIDLDKMGDAVKRDMEKSAAAARKSGRNSSLHRR